MVPPRLSGGMTQFSTGAQVAAQRHREMVRASLLAKAEHRRRKREQKEATQVGLPNIRSDHCSLDE